jgi:hypothetical protein
MQRFNAPLPPQDKAIARRVGRIVLIAYSSVALALTAGVIAHIRLKQPAVASTSEGTMATGSVDRPSPKAVPSMTDTRVRF